MKRTMVCLCIAASSACAGSGEESQNNTNNRTTANNVSPNNRPSNNTTSNNTTVANNTSGTTSANNTNSNTTSNNTTATTGNNGTNNGTPQWRALVANAELTGDQSTWNLVVFDGAEASTTFPQSFGSGNIAVAASGDRGYVVDLDTGTTLVIDAERGTEVETIELGTGDLDDVAAGNGRLIAASSANRRLVQYTNDVGSPITLPAPSPSGTPFVRNIVMDGDLVAGVWGETAQFPTTPGVFLADPATAALVEPQPGEELIEINGAQRVAPRGNGTFVLATELDGLMHIRQDGANWVAETIVPRVEFDNAELQNVVMATEERGVALTYDTDFVAYAFDTINQTATPIDGFALPSPITGGDASRDGAYVFIGDYGIRDQEPWGVGIVDETGQLVDHVETDPNLPPADIAALN